MAPALPTHPRAFFLAAALAMVGVAEAGYGFLARMDRDAVAHQLLNEVSALLGHGTKHERLMHLEHAMRPMYMSLPKQSGGGIDQGVARYALNRYFLTHRGWHIAGIAPNGTGWNESSSMAALKPKMPSFVIEILEEHVARKRLGLEELAVLAATVEDLVHSDALEVLTMAYEAHSLSMHEPLENEAKEDLVIETFLLFYTMPWTQEVRNKSSAVRNFLKTAPKTNPGWNDTMLWVEDLKGAIKYQDRAVHSPFAKKHCPSSSSSSSYFRNYPSMVHLAEQIIDGYGIFQDIQCRELKNVLMDLEAQDRNDGRVLLANFYRPYMQGISSFFIESPEYLRSLGSLDDSDPGMPSVIVPNFLYGRNFCIAADNAFQSFCCVDQCSALMETLERSVARPVAAPGLIAELVAALPSDTVAAPRNLSGSLRWKLDAIAEQNGGHVPLHGRLFAQWLHHAFPNECPQPRAPGGAAEAPMTSEEWRARRNTSAEAPKEVMRQLADRAAEANGTAGQDETCMPWTDDEELLTSIDLTALGSPRSERPYGQEGSLQRALRLLAMCGAGASLIAILSENLRSSRSLLWPQGPKKAPSRADGLPGRLHLI